MDQNKVLFKSPFNTRSMYCEHSSQCLGPAKVHFNIDFSGRMELGLTSREGQIYLYTLRLARVESLLPYFHQTQC